VREKWRLKQVDVIPYPFDLKDFSPDLSVYEKHVKGTEYLLFYGRLEVRKGPQVLSQALPSILRSYPGLKMAFVGENLPYGKTTMKQYIQENNKEFINDLIFIPNVPHDQLYPIIQNSKLVILPSLWDNLPFACLEAMSFGKVVIATLGSGFAEMIEDGRSGILVEPGKPEALGKAVMEALVRKDLDALGVRAKERASEFRSSSIVDRISNSYRDIIRRRGGTAT